MILPQRSASVPRWVWIMALGGSGLVVLVTFGAALWIAGGGTDPPVAGPVAWDDRALAWADSGAWSPAPVEPAIPPGAFTLEVRARQPADADPLAAWGVWLAADDGSRVIYAISAAGYVTTRRCPEGVLPDAPIEDCPALRPEWRWMPYPRVNPPGSANTVSLHRESSGAIRLRLNNEILGAAPVAVSGAWGVWWRDAIPDWERATLHLPE